MSREIFEPYDDNDLRQNQLYQAEQEWLSHNHSDECPYCYAGSVELIYNSKVDFGICDCCGRKVEL